jgi:NTP pyrophosphatase (non-canonical NTP hydrolase)
MMQGRQIQRNREALEARVAELEAERDSLAAQLRAADPLRLTLSEYQTLAARTAPTDLSPEDRRLNCAMGLVGEGGELVDLLKKARFHGHSDGLTDKLRDEFGDVLWYLAEAATISGLELSLPFTYDPAESILDVSMGIASNALRISRGGSPDASTLRALVGDVRDLIEQHGLTLHEVLKRNVDKLTERYPDGFDKARSQARVDAQPDRWCKCPRCGHVDRMAFGPGHDDRNGYQSAYWAKHDLLSPVTQLVDDRFACPGCTHPVEGSLLEYEVPEPQATSTGWATYANLPDGPVERRKVKPCQWCAGGTWARKVVSPLKGDDRIMCKECHRLGDLP